MLPETAHLDTFLPLAVRSFLNLADVSVGTEWVDIVGVALKRQPFAGRTELLKRFEAMVYVPALDQLSTIMDPQVQQLAAMREFQQFLDERQLPHLGLYYTRHALLALGWDTPDASAQWVRAARLEVWATQGLSVGTLVRTERILAWVTAHFWFNDIQIKIPGRVFHSGVPPEIDEDVKRMLRATYRHMARDDHAERAAMLSVVWTVLQECRSGTAALGHVNGMLRLYISHFPCMSCVAVLGQLARHAPCAKFEIAFDDAWDDQ